VDKAKQDILFSDIAVSRGATAYSNPKEAEPTLKDDERQIQ
jgi:hypothetical protein